jgi:heat shock protein HslJ
MTDHDPTNDDELDARLRAGLAALAAEAPEPPAFDDLGRGSASAAAPGRRRALLVAASVLVTLAFAAALFVALRPHDSSVKVVDSTPRAERPAPLIGTQWTLVSAERKGITTQAAGVWSGFIQFTTSGSCAKPGCTLPVTAINSSDGCNPIDAPATLVGDRVTLGGYVEMGTGCAGVGHDISMFLDPFANGFTVQVVGQRLRLTTADHRVLVYAASGLALPGIEWNLASIAIGKGSLLAPAKVDAHLSFGTASGCAFYPVGGLGSTTTTSPSECPKTTMDGSDGCNDFQARVLIAGDRMVVPQYGMTVVACLRPSVSRVSKAFDAMFHGTSRLRQDGDGLTITASNGTRLFFVGEAVQQAADTTPGYFLDGVQWQLAKWDQPTVASTLRAIHGVGLVFDPDTASTSGQYSVLAQSGCTFLDLSGSITDEIGDSSSPVRTGRFSGFTHETGNGRQASQPTECPIGTALSPHASTELGATLDRALQGGSFRVSRDELVLVDASGHDLATFDAVELTSTPYHSQPFASGMTGGYSYVLSWQAGPHDQVLVQYEVGPTVHRSPSDRTLSSIIAAPADTPGRPAGVDPEPVAARLPLPTEILVYGIAPKGTVRVTVTYTGRAPVALTLHPVDGGSAVLFASVVPGDIGGKAVVTASGADGHPLGTWTGTL